MPRILITGGTGLLGVNWAFARKHQDEVILAAHHRQITIEGVLLQKIDLTSAVNIFSAIEEIKPDFVVHAASLTSVEKCEHNLNLAEEVNVDLAFNVAKACNASGVKLVHISTDHLFAGDRPFVEERQSLEPLNAYGTTKARAESLVLGVNPDSLVVRTNFFGWGPSYRKSFSDFIIEALRNGFEVKLFYDVFYSPILIEVLIEKIEKLLLVGARGIFNIVGDDRITKYQFGLYLAKEFELNVGLIKPISIHSLNELVVRPLDMSLSNKKISNIIDCKVGGIECHINKLRVQELTGISSKIKQL